MITKQEARANADAHKSLTEKVWEESQEDILKAISADVEKRSKEGYTHLDFDHSKYFSSPNYDFTTQIQKIMRGLGFHFEARTSGYRISW